MLHLGLVNESNLQPRRDGLKQRRAVDILFLNIILFGKLSMSAPSLRL